MKKLRIKHTAMAIAVASIGHAAYAQSTPEMQQALREAQQAAEAARAAASKAEAALEKAQAQAAAAEASAQQAKATTVPAVVPPPTSVASGGLYVTGSLDAGVRITKNSDSTRNRTEITNNNSSTSLFLFRGYRTLPMGMTASFLLELDINPVSSTTASSGGGSNAFQGTPFNGEEYIDLTGAWGNVKLGTPNAAVFVAAAAAQPFATAVGSGYSGNFGRLGTSAVSSISQIDGVGGGRIFRHEKTIKYTSPTFEGFSGSAEFSPGNDRASSVTSNNNKYVGLGLQYNRGPLNTYYGYAKVSAGQNAAAGAAAAIGTTPTAALPANTNVTWNFLSANYTVGQTTIYGGLSTTKSGGGAVVLEDSRSWNIAAKYALSSQWDLLANYVARNTKLTTAGDAKLLGLGVNYWIDKQTSIYGRAELQKIDAFGATSSVNNRIFSTGVRYQF